jgi:hypothetical protein
MFSKMQLTILEMLSLSLTGKANEISLEELNTSELISECSEQGILNLVSDYLSPLCKDKKEENTLLFRCVRHIHITQSILKAQEELLELLYSNGFHPLILKGWAAAQYYPSPDKRTFGDIDILFSEEEFYSAVDLLVANGFAHRDKEARVDHHLPLVKDGIVIEPHIAVGGLPEKENAREYLKQLFYDGLKKPAVKSLLGYEMPFFPDLQNGLVLLLHIRGHLKGGLGLRQIADWMVFVKLHLDDNAYKTEWEEILDKAGLDKLAKVSTALCIKYLGLEGNYTWCNDADDKTVDRMMTFIFEQGNFGHLYDQCNRKFKQQLSPFKQGPIHLSHRWCPAQSALPSDSAYYEEMDYGTERLGENYWRTEDYGRVRNLLKQPTIQKHGIAIPILQKL